MITAASIREVVSDLSGYLCGTNHLLRRGVRSVGPESIAARHHRITENHESDDVRVPLGIRRWGPEAEASRLRDRLLETLTAPGVVDLILFGSHARGSTTGYSDLDAILLLDDSAVDDANVLRALRPQVLAAQRAVLAHQPMQHHGFIVVSRRLLSRASDALGMPREGVAETVSLLGTCLRVASPLSQIPGELFKHSAKQSWSRPSGLVMLGRFICASRCSLCFRRSTCKRPADRPSSILLLR